MFSNLTGVAFCAEETEPGNIYITDNRYYSCGGMSSGIPLGDHNLEIPNPYKLCPNGSFYGAAWDYLWESEEHYYDYEGPGENNQLVDEGETLSSYPSEIINEIKCRTIFRPFVLSNSTINNSTSGDCASYNFRSSELVEKYPDRIESGSTYKVDIGFHYDPVHGCVMSGTDAPTLTTELILDKGAVVSYTPSAKLTVNNTSTPNLIAEGLPDNMIRFTSTAATGDFIAVPSAGDYDYALYYTYLVPGGRVNFAIVEYSNAGIVSFGPCYAMPTRLRVQNSIVRNCNTGISAMNTHINVLNSLMTGNTNAVYLGNVETYYGVDANIEGCTFDANTHAFYQALGGVNESELLIEDNIFSSQTDTALRVFFGFSGTTSVVRNNLFWNNAQDVTPGFLTILPEDGNIQDENPLFCHRARATDGKTVLEPDPVTNKLNSFDGYYMVQGNGDASRRPLRLGDITGIGPFKRIYGYDGEVFEDTIQVHYCIEVRVSEQIPGSWYTFTLLGASEWEGVGGPIYIDGDETAPMPVAVRIKTYDDGIPPVPGTVYGYYFDITIANGSTVRVWLPPFTLNAYQLAAYWVSEDGSTYFTNMAHTEVFSFGASISTVFDTDSYYALRWDTSTANGGQPAQAGYDVGNYINAGTSPAVDAGTVDLLNAGTSKTEISVNNKNIGDQPYSGWDSITNLRIWADEPSQAKPKLDVGYHYSGDAYTVKVSEGEYEKQAVAIRFPKQGVNQEVAVDYITVADEVEVHYWLDKGDAAKTVFSGYRYHAGTWAERTGAVFETRPIHEGNRNLPGWTEAEIDELFAEEDIRLRLGYAMFRDTPAGIMQDSAITDSHVLGNDDIYKGFTILPGDPSYFDPVEYPPGSGSYYSSGNIRWKITSLESVTVPFHRRANNSDSVHKGESYVGVTLNLSMHDGSDSAYNPSQQGTDMQDFRGRYVASVLRIYRYDLSKSPPWALIAENVNKVSGFDIDNPLRPTGYPSQNYITTDIRNLSLAVHEDIYGNVSVYAFWLENTTANRLVPHYKLYGKQITNAQSRSGSGRLEITDANRVPLDDLLSGTGPDRISADLDQWIRNNQGNLPSGYSGVPRLVYGRTDQKKIRTMRITLSSNGEVFGIHADGYLPDAGIEPGTPYMSINRSKQHDPIATHAFAAMETATIAGAQYTLSLSGAYYDTDDWSDPEEIESWVSGLVVRPVGSPRVVWGKAPYPIMSNTGEIDSYGETVPRIALDPYQGKYDGPNYWNTWITARNVFVCFSATGGNPGPNWDTDGDGVTQEYDPVLGWIRDQGDLVPTIIFKQGDP
jgi:hypothetical protein